MSGVFGVRGEVRLHLHNRESTLFDGAVAVTLLGPTGVREQLVLTVRPGAGKRVIGQIEGVCNPDLARSYMKWRILVPSQSLPPTEDGEFYVWQVQGLPVFVGDSRVGVVVGVHETAAHDVFEIQLDRDDSLVFVPSVAAFVQAVNVEQGRVDLMPEALQQ